MNRQIALVLVLTAVIVGSAAPADAYIGPGAGITVIGTVVAFLAAVAFAIVGFVWYPIKRLVGLARQRRSRGDVV